MIKSIKRGFIIGYFLVINGDLNANRDIIDSLG